MARDGILMHRRDASWFFGGSKLPICALWLVTFKGYTGTSKPTGLLASSQPRKSSFTLCCDYLFGTNPPLTPRSFPGCGLSHSICTVLRTPLPATFKNLLARAMSDDNKEQSENNEAPNPKLPKIVSFDEIARCGNEIWIENNGELYRLQKTKNGKLIMTK